MSHVFWDLFFELFFDVLLYFNQLFSYLISRNVLIILTCFWLLLNFFSNFRISCYLNLVIYFYPALLLLSNSTTFDTTHIKRSELLFVVFVLFFLNWGIVIRCRPIGIKRWLLRLFFLILLWCCIIPINIVCCCWFLKMFWFVLSFIFGLFIFIDGKVFLQRVINGISGIFLFFTDGSSCKIGVILFWIFSGRINFISFSLWGLDCGCSLSIATQTLSRINLLICCRSCLMSFVSVVLLLRYWLLIHTDINFPALS